MKNFSYGEYMKMLKNHPYYDPQRITGVSKKSYADLIAKCLAEYDNVNNVRKLTINSVSNTLQAYSRIVSSMSVLYAQGGIEKYRLVFPCRLFESEEIFNSRYEEMMDEACKSAADDFSGEDVENFSVKELCLAYAISREKAGKRSNLWASDLSRVTRDHYTCAKKAENRNIYVIAGEQIREYYGLCDARSLIDESWEMQRSHFNDKGMYLDNFDKDIEHNPTLYDLTTRVQLSLVLRFGYNGKYRQEIEELLRKGSLVTLFDQSAAYCLAYGGRSNGYLFNEMLIAADCEWAALSHKETGDVGTAAVFKRAAHLAIRSVKPYLNAGKHIRNYFIDRAVGTESYGYYDKYMATMSSFLAIAYLYADDEIPEKPCPCEIGGYVTQDEENFHNIIASSGKTSVQIMTDADFGYDSVGLGRIHSAGLPGELILSRPFCREPHYKLPDGKKSANLSLDATWEGPDGERVLLADINGTEHTLEINGAEPGNVEFVLTYSGEALESKGLTKLTEKYTVTDSEVSIHLEAEGTAKIGLTLPVLEYNGDDEACASRTIVRSSKRGIDVSMGKYSYSAVCDGTLEKTGDKLCSRNGKYRIYRLCSSGTKLTVKILMKPETFSPVQG